MTPEMRFKLATLLVTMSLVGLAPGAALAITSGAIGDYVWFDANVNGLQDDGPSAGIPGVPVYLDYYIADMGGLSGTLSLTTDSNGYYLFSGLPAGSYRVWLGPSASGLQNRAQTFDYDDGITLPPTGPVTGYSASLTLARGEYNLDVDFGYAPCAEEDDNRPFVTFTQGGWGSKPRGNNPGALLATNFATVYPGGVTIGGWHTLRFTSANAIEVFLPQGGTPGVLRASAIDPTKRTSAGVFAGQVLALQLNVDFSNAGITTPGLANLKVAWGELAGWTVAQVLALANQVLGGDISQLGGLGLTVAGLNDAVTMINENFDGGEVDRGFLVP